MRALFRFSVFFIIIKGSAQSDTYIHTYVDDGVRGVENEDFEDVKEESGLVCKALPR